MAGTQSLVAAIVVFAGGLATAVIAMARFSDAYAWVAHTADVRVVIGRAVGRAGQASSCELLRRDVADLAALTDDNPRQQQRMPALRASVETTCAAQPAPELVAQLSEIDATERTLMAERRARLAGTRQWSTLAFLLSAGGAIGAVVVARLLQIRALRALADSEDRFRLLASSASDLIRIHDAAGRPTYVSPSVERLLGYTPEEILAKVPLVLGHPDDLERMQQALADVQKDHGAATTLVYRLRAKDGTYRWFETHTNPIRDRDGKLLRFNTTARDVTERVDLEQKLERSAVTDVLTGLLNRRGFELIAHQEHRVAIRSQHDIAVIFADLDGLKSINDNLGHEQGDAAIRQLATLLRATFRDSDVVARLGGDEFAVLLYNVDESAAQIAVARLQAAVGAAPPVGTYPLAVSVGVALLQPGGQTSLDELVAEADRRMYETKRARKALRSG